MFGGSTMKYVGKKVEDIKIAYIGGGSRGWAWGLMSDLASADDISGTVRLYDIDKQAADLYDTMYAKLSNAERFRKTGDFIKDLQSETEIKGIIETEILNELVYSI